LSRCRTPAVCAQHHLTSVHGYLSPKYDLLQTPVLEYMFILQIRGLRDDSFIVSRPERL
jgi:hypothetical protein